MTQLFANVARAELAANITNVATSLTVTASGDLFPVANTGTSAIGPGADWFKLVLQDNAGIEIVFCRTHTSGNTVFADLLRGQEGTTARAFTAGAIVGLRPTAGDATDVQTALADKISVAAFNAKIGAATRYLITSAQSLTIDSTNADTYQNALIQLTGAASPATLNINTTGMPAGWQCRIQLAASTANNLLVIDGTSRFSDRSGLMLIDLILYAGGYFYYEVISSAVVGNTVATFGTPVALGAAANAGSGYRFARDNHVHPFPTAADLSLATVATTGAYADLTGKPDLTGYATKTGAETLTNKTLTAPTITGYTETVYALVGTDINPANGTIQTKTLAANTTFTESLADGQSVVLMLNPATFTTTWPTISWVNAAGSGAAPTLKASAINVLVLWQVGGVLYGNWIGSL